MSRPSSGRNGSPRWRRTRSTPRAIARTGRADTKFLHCLPAYHDRATTVGRAALDRFDDRYNLGGGLEVTDEVFRSSANVCFDQAENRLHTIKALMVATLS